MCFMQLLCLGVSSVCNKGLLILIYKGFFEDISEVCMRIMGIDYGDSRIGIAISDPMGWTAQGLETIKWKTDIEVPLKRISQLIKGMISKNYCGFS